MRFPPIALAGPLSDFATLPASGVKISSGFVDGAPKAWVTIHQGGLVQQYGFNPADGTGLSEGEVTGINPPHGVADATSSSGGFIPTGVGSTTTRIPGDQVTFENVETGGVLTSQLIKFYETRTCGSRDTGEPCVGNLELFDIAISAGYFNFV